MAFLSGAHAQPDSRWAGPSGSETVTVMVSTARTLIVVFGASASTKGLGVPGRVNDAGAEQE